MKRDNSQKEVEVSDWATFYRASFNVIHFLKCIFQHIYYLGLLISLKKRKCLEAGCGTAAHSRFVNSLWPDQRVLCLDKEIELLKKIQIIYRNKLGKKKLLLICGDLKSLPFRDKSFDLIFSQGVLEHFRNGDLENILKEQARSGKKVIASVPSDNIFEYPHGDEIPRSPEDWQRILTECFGQYEISFGAKYYAFDVGIQSRSSLFQKLRREEKITLFRAIIKTIVLPLHIIIHIEQDIFPSFPARNVNMGFIA
jgi:SAM-dependent methyltransferase